MDELRRPGRTDVGAPVLLACIAGVSVVLAHVSTRWGIAISPDSAAYLSAADHLARTGRLDTYDMVPLTDFPPGYPLLVRGAMPFAGSVDAAARVVAIVTAAVLPVLTWLLARRLGAGPWWSLAAAGVVTASPVLGMTVRSAWTEPTFAVVLLGLVLVLVSAPTDRPVSWCRLGVLVLLTWLAVLVRYVGIGLVAAVPVALLVLGHRRGAGANRTLWVRSGAFAVVAAAGVALLMLWNSARADTIGGPTFLPRSSVIADLEEVFAAFSSWVAPQVFFPRAGHVIVGVGVVTGLIACTVWLARVRRRRAVAVMPVAVMSVAVMSVAGVLLGFVVVSARVRWVLIDPRMLVPFLPLSAAVGAVVASTVTTGSGATGPGATGSGATGRPRGRWRHRAAVAGVVTGVGIVVALTGARSVIEASAAADRGLWFTHEDWRTSPLMAAVDELPPDTALVSSAADAVWAVTRRRPVFLSPPASGVPDAARRRDDERFTAVACAEGYLAWFVNGRPYLVPPDGLRARAELTTVAEFPDGTLYRLTGRDC
jgi:hypothetical protein